MSDPFLGEVRIFSYLYPSAPMGWAFCDGQLLQIVQNTALFSILGNTYGGNGSTTFALPNLQGRMPIHVGDGFTLGQQGGEAAHTLSISEMPKHTHPVTASGNLADQSAAAGNLWATVSRNSYSGTVNTNMNPAAVLAAGGSQAHSNMPPYMVLSFCIALQGIYPTRPE